ncbi:alginate O-acetyltransferase AlgF [Rhodovarius lipocyclicus]|uniref:alginate O-acetyltransferase AlgF n=1 Tax=Rhodovarius lipocyclicus TaxID=268410 RepID=UPI00135A5A85|nr:alginate O-acetyltransferase AlgF [Rhodovarius lipocyclicus]
MMARFSLMLRALLLMSLMAVPAQAQQVLYEPLPPAGSAYLRVVNATAVALSLRPAMAGVESVAVTQAQRVTAYAVQENVAARPVAARLQAGEAQTEVSLDLEPGSFNTLIVTHEGGALRATLFRDETQFNQLRARLTFYNATAGCGQASLVLEPQGQAVFQDAPPGEGRMRSVNPVTAQVRASCGSLRSEVFALQGLEQGGVYSIWLMAPGGRPLAFLSRDVTAPWRR